MALETFANTPTPSSPATAWTTISGALTSGFATITVVDGSVFPSSGQFRVLIGNNGIVVTRSSNVLTVVSHEFGEAEHASGSAIYHVVTAGSLANHPRAMTTAGDLEYLSAALSPTRLGIGTNGYFLSVSAGLPAWAAVTAAGIGAEVPLTFSTGLTRSTNTVTVNTTQNIAKLSNLTGNGIVTTSGGDGTLSVTATTGSGSVVLATSPTLVTPALGAATFTSLTGSGATVTASTPLLALSQTWNNSGVAFTGISLSITSTASSSSSLLVDLKLGGNSQFTVDKDGYVSIRGTSGLIRAAQAGGSLTLRPGSVGSITLSDANSSSTSLGVVVKAANATYSQSSGTLRAFEVSPVYNQSGTAANRDLVVNRTETALGSGEQSLLWLGVASNARMRVSNTGSVLAAVGSSIPAGGTAGLGYLLSSTSNFGVFFGSGAPSLAAAKGSLYLRSDGTTTNDRAYINTDGGTTWTPLATAA